MRWPGTRKARGRPGCDSFVTKPCLPDALVAEIQRMLAARSEPEAALPEEERQDRTRPGTDRSSTAATSMAKTQKKTKAPVAEQAHGRRRGPQRVREGAAGRPGRPRQARARPDAGADCAQKRPRLRPGGTEDSNEGKYVYCIIKSERPLGFGPLGIGVDPADVHTVHYRDIAAVVSNTPMVVQDPTRDNVLAHQRVNETVMQQHTVIPMSFGTVFKTDDDIMELLRSAYDAFTDVLNKMQDKFEFGLKVLWDRDQIIREIEEEDEDIRRLKGEISSQKGSTYFARMQYGRLIDAALQARSERYVAEIFEALRDVSVASRSNKPIGDRMIMNAAFLVARDTRAGLRRARQGHRPALRQADVQVHRTVAAVQLRQHPPEAGAGALRNGRRTTEVG